ncbi:MAG: PQQ-binding-like beta-propeller repeat protein [Solirubrobacteraceae bacterium]
MNARHRKRRLLLAATVLLLLAGGGIALIAIRHHRPGDVFHRSAPFHAEQTPRVARGRHVAPWPMYGFTKNHDRYYPASPKLRPPYRRIWRFSGNALLEFPPVIDNSTVYQLNDSGVMHALATDSGRVRWQRRLGTLAASSPAASGSSVYATLLQHGAGDRGRVISVRQLDGHVRWIRDLPSRSESSPLLDRGRLYLGSESGVVYGLDAHHGRVLWTYHAGGAVKASPTLREGKLYFGDYGGHVQAIREDNGKRVWLAGSGKGLISGGNFYSTAAASYGRVFLGNTDGRVYAFDARTGRLAWAKQTGAYVYSSPAVNDTKGLGPTVYVGSYDGRFYALSAYSGAVRWEYDAHGKISGSPTIVGSIVYFAVLGSHYTVGLDTRTGRQVYARHNGSFDPVITDGSRIFLTGNTGLFALIPTGRRRVPAPRRPASSPQRASSTHRAVARRASICPTMFVVSLTSPGSGAC